MIKETDCLNHLSFFMFYRHFFILLSELTLRVLQKLIQSSHFFIILITEINMKLSERILNIICWNSWSCKAELLECLLFDMIFFILIITFRVFEKSTKINMKHMMQQSSSYHQCSFYNILKKYVSKTSSIFHELIINKLTRSLW